MSTDRKRLACWAREKVTVKKDKWGNRVQILTTTTSYKRYHLALCLILILCHCCVSGSHEPFKWTLSRWETHDTLYELQSVTSSQAPSFIAGICNMTRAPSCGQLLNITSFYMCPASNPGKSYCNWPGHYYCAYWGCETTAFGFPPGGGPDRYLKVDYGPFGCKKPADWIPGCMGTREHCWGNCTYFYFNVTQPDDAGWLLGRTWGIRHWQEGTDMGSLIHIKKERIPHSGSPVGPNPVIAEGMGGGDTPVNTTEEGSAYNESTVPLQKSSALWEVMQATFTVLNHTYPNLTEGCWLCYMMNPPFYEAIGSPAKVRRMNGTNPRECLWKQKGDSSPGITLGQVSGKGTCVGKVPEKMQHLCNRTINKTRSDKPGQWLVPAANTKWVCNKLGVTPCLSIEHFNENSEYCIQVLVVPRISYHPKEYVLEHQITPEHHLVKKEPFTALTVAVLLSIGGAGIGTGAVALINQQRGMKDLRTAVDEDLSRIDTAITELVKSVRSLSEVVLQNRRGLDLLLLQQGGLCAAL